MIPYDCLRDVHRNSLTNVVVLRNIFWLVGFIRYADFSWNTRGVANQRLT